MKYLIKITSIATILTLAAGSVARWRGWRSVHDVARMGDFGTGMGHTSLQ